MLFPPRKKRMFVVCSLLVVPTVTFSKAGFSQVHKKPSIFQSATAPQPPTGEQLARCLDFSTPVSLKREKIPKGLASRSVTPLWSYVYRSEHDAYFYTVELYKGRSLFGSHRKQIEQKLESFKQNKSVRPELDLSQVMGVLPLAKGRKVYFNVLGFGPRGAAYCAFTTIGKYDLVITTVEVDEPPPASKGVVGVPRRRIPQALAQIQQVMEAS